MHIIQSSIVSPIKTFIYMADISLMKSKIKLIDLKKCSFFVKKI